VFCEFLAGKHGSIRLDKGFGGEGVASAWRNWEFCAVFLVEIFGNKRGTKSHLNMLRVTFGDDLGELL